MVVGNSQERTRRRREKLALLLMDVMSVRACFVSARHFCSYHKLGQADIPRHCFRFVWVPNLSLKMEKVWRYELMEIFPTTSIINIIIPSWHDKRGKQWISMLFFLEMEYRTCHCHFILTESLTAETTAMSLPKWTLEIGKYGWICKSTKSFQS